MVVNDPIGPRHFLHQVLERSIWIALKGVILVIQLVRFLHWRVVIELFRAHHQVFFVTYGLAKLIYDLLMFLQILDYKD